MAGDNTFSAARRRVLYMFGLGAAAAGIRTIAASDNLFAKQFARKATTVKLPNMVYDRELQMMVDPSTRKPIYSQFADDEGEKKPKPKPLPTVTAGCKDCPKCDDNCG